MDTETTDGLLAIHLTRLVGYALKVAGYGLAVTAAVTLVVGGFAWQSGHMGWVFASPAIGLLVFGVLLLVSSAPEPWLDED